MNYIKLILFIMMFSNILYAKEDTLLHVSYDPTRELYQEINKIFIEDIKHKTGKIIKIRQSHGGSAKQAKSVIDGLDADIVSLANDFDIDMIAKHNLIENKWRDEFPNKSSPYNSVIVFVVRKNNPKSIKNWDDLVRDDVSVITPNPKISGGAKWNYIAAFGYAKELYKDDEKAIEFVSKLYNNVPIFDTAARSATISFAKRKIGDVLIAWENEALLTIEQFKSDEFEIIIPSVTIKIDLPVTMVNKNTEKHSTTDLVKSYIDFLYSDKGQDIILKNHYRPYIMKDRYKNIFPDVNLISTEMIYSDIDDFYHKHFDREGIFDQIYAKRK